MGARQEQRRAPRAAFTVLALVVLVAVGLGGCGEKTRHRSMAATLVEGSAGFAPGLITVNKGDRVDIRVDNTTDKTHGFTIDGYGVRARTVDPGHPIHVRFTAKKAGRFRIFCQLHKTHQPATFTVL